MDIPASTFTILAIGPFAPVPEASFKARVIPVETLNDALAMLKPVLWVPIPVELCPDGGITICPGHMKDLSPDGMIETVGYLKDLSDARDFIGKCASEAVGPGGIADAVREKWPRLPIELSYVSGDRNAPSNDRVDDILSMVAMDGKPASPAKAVDGGPAVWAKKIGDLLSRLMELIFSDEAFRSFEASWRGAEILLKQGPAGPAKETRLSIACASQANLGDVLDNLTMLLSSDPPDLVLIDIPFDNTPAGVELMDKAAAFGEALLAPAVISITPRFFDIPGWSDLHRLPYLKHQIEDNPVYAKWNKLRTGGAWDWLVLTCNPFLTRPVYGDEQRPHSVNFNETSPLWIGPVWALGTLTAMSNDRYGWPSRLTDSGNVRLEGLALHSIEGDMRASTEAVLSPNRLKQFGEIGISPLCGIAMKDNAFMPAAHTASGESLSFRMFFARLTGFLIRLREMAGTPLPGDDAGPWLENAIDLFFRKTGVNLPEEPSVSLIAGETDARPIFQISLTPPRAVVSEGARITFNFAW